MMRIWNQETNFREKTNARKCRLQILIRIKNLSRLHDRTKIISEGLVTSCSAMRSNHGKKASRQTFLQSMEARQRDLIPFHRCVSFLPTVSVNLDYVAHESFLHNKNHSYDSSQNM